jgi:hypothetical protein
MRANLTTQGYRLSGIERSELRLVERLSHQRSGARRRCL